MADFVIVGSNQAFQLEAPANENLRVTHEGGQTVYYSTSPRVSTIINDGSLTTGGQFTFSGKRFFIAQAGTGTQGSSASLRLDPIPLVGETIGSVFGYNVLDYGVTGTGDDTAGLANAISSVPAGSWLVFPAGSYEYTTLTINKSLTLVGLGISGAYRNGANGDVQDIGVELICTATSGNGILVEPPAATRLHFATDGITFVGNGDQAGATAGGGVRLKAASATSAILPDLRRTNFIRAYGDNLILEGNVFEGALTGVQCNQSVAGRGLVALTSGGGIPGEISLTGVTCDYNGTVGCDLSGGSVWDFLRLSCSNNTQEGFKADGIKLYGHGLGLEQNSTTRFALINNMGAFQIGGVGINYGTSTAAVGIAMTNCLWGHISGFSSNSGAGNLDFTLDSDCQSCTVEDYLGGSSTDRYTDGGYWTRVTRGGRWLTPRNPNVQLATLAANGTVTADATKYEKLYVNVTGAGANLTVGGPTITAAASAHRGNRMTVDVRNSSGGAMGTVTFGGSFLLTGGVALTAPANGKRRKIEFEYDDSTNNWAERWRSTGDI